MSSTNKTTYYELPQFVDNDIFNPLVDDNDAYSKIDTALHNIADVEADNASDIVDIKSRLSGAEDDIDALETQNGSDVLTTVAQTLSGAVNELKSEDSALDNRITTVEDDINNVTTGLKVKVANDELNITALQQQNGNEHLSTVAQTLSGAVNELMNNSRGVFDYSNKDDVIVIGDSWTAGLHATHGMWHWLYLYLPHNAFYHNQESGAGFATAGVNGNKFIDLLTALVSDIPNPDSIKHIIFMGGLNDQGANNLGSAIDACVQYAHTTFKNAGIELIAVNRTQFGAVDRYDYCTYMLVTASSYPYTRFFDLTKVVPANQFYNTSHLTETGYTIMSYSVINALVAGTISCPNSKRTLHATSTPQGISTNVYEYQNSDGSLSIYFPIINSSGTFNAGGLIKHLTFTFDSAITGVTDITYPLAVYVTDANGSYYLPALAIFTSETTMILEWIHSNSSADYSSIYIQPITINEGKMY